MNFYEFIGNRDLARVVYSFTGSRRAQKFEKRMEAVLWLKSKSGPCDRVEPRTMAVLPELVDGLLKFNPNWCPQKRFQTAMDMCRTAKWGSHYFNRDLDYMYYSPVVYNKTGVPMSEEEKEAAIEVMEASIKIQEDFFQPIKDYWTELYQEVRDGS